MLTGDFWICTVERAFRTFLQTLAAMLSAAGIGLLNAPWATALSTAGMAAFLSVVNAVAVAPIGVPGSPSALPPRTVAKLSDRRATVAS